MTNPLLLPFSTPHQVPPFADIQPEHYMPALKECIEIARAEVLAIAENPEPADFYNTIVAVENTGEQMGKVTSILFNLNSAETSPEMQKISQEASPLLTAFNNEVKQNSALFDRIKMIYNQRAELNLDPEDEMLLVKTYKSFIRSGAGLTPENEKKFGEIAVQLSSLGLKFGENVLAETNAFELIVDNEADLAGLPTDVINRAKSLAIENGKKDSWVFTLQMPSYIPFMEYADNRKLREQMFKAHTSKCLKGDDKDNQALVKQIVKLRHQLAEILGYESYAQFILEERMAESGDKVMEFLTELLEKAKPKANEEHNELAEFAENMGLSDELQRWDWSYYSEKLKKSRYDLDDELTKPYFKLENVINGVFETAEKLYGLTFKVNGDIPVYHEDVTAYEVYEAGRLKAIFLADFFPRPGKRDGAWMTSYRNERRMGEERVIPIISIVCNFTPSSADAPSLLKFNEVLTLFHEFGHALHGMLADTRYESLSGTSVYWDFVELPSQIMENWCYERECLDLFARHYETNEPIPAEYIERIRNASTFHEAYATLRQISFGLLDMAYHGSNEEIRDVLTFEREAMKSTDLFPEVEQSAMSTQFSHIFAGGYAAGYYSYKWAEVLDADAFEMFLERGVFDAETAQSFKESILSKGGTEPPMDLYRRFRGKNPSPDALLKRAGLI